MCMYACVHVVCVCVHMQQHVCVHVCMCIHMRVCMCVCVRASHVHVCTHVHEMHPKECPMTLQVFQ